MSSLLSLSPLPRLVSVVAALIAIAVPLFAADLGDWAGEFKTTRLLKGQAVLQLSIAQQGSTVQVTFDASRKDGQGAAPEGEGPAKVVDKETLQFEFEDSFKNAGTGTIKRKGNDIIVSFEPTTVVDSRSMMFYGDNILLKRVRRK